MHEPLPYDPAAFREFELAGWQRIVDSYDGYPGTLTAHTGEPLLDAASRREPGPFIGRRRTISGLLAASATFMSSRLDTGAARKRKKKCKAKNKNERQDKPLPRLAVSCQGPNPGEFAGSGLRRIARTFAAQESGLLHSIEVTVANVAGAGDFSLQLVAVKDGAPSASPLDVLAVALVPDSGVSSDPSPLIGRFNGPPLIAGMEYAVVVSRPGSGVDLFAVVIASDTGCPGQMFFASGSDPFVPLTFDMPISVFVV